MVRADMRAQTVKTESEPANNTQKYCLWMTDAEQHNKTHFKLKSMHLLTSDIMDIGCEMIWMVRNHGIKFPKVKNPQKIKQITL